MIVDSDTSPVLNLARTGRIELLPLLYLQVLIPSAVYEELTASKRDLPPAIDLAAAPNRVQELREDLDPGEAEAIVLAIERRAASAADLTVTGLPGVGAGAKKLG